MQLRLAETIVLILIRLRLATVILRVVLMRVQTLFLVTRLHIEIISMFSLFLDEDALLVLIL